MARITPASGATLDLTEVEEHEPYKVKLKKIDWTTGAAQYGSGRRLTVDWEFDGTDGDNVRDWIDLRLGQMQNGKPAKLRMLLNALAEKDAGEPIKWFDDETYEWSYDGNAPWAKLVTGVEVIIRGHFVIREDKQGKRYAIDTYQHPNVLRRKRAPATADAVDDKEIPF
jgi:hypothetical protein